MCLSLPIPAPLAGIAGSNPARGKDVCLFECWVMAGIGRCDRPIRHPEEFYRVWCDSV